ncbi:phosphatase PAP2 family protein [Tellurirhabdus bombi]|uniref:phosphatase PAP2 family protein n=1 Tax=Tellurirhabdus bombi TaxID=2907205 RepID=UPI001F264807|nr:phosphatase PAP2 family protein [Tellurirhabdus bombi]
MSLQNIHLKFPLLLLFWLTLLRTFAQPIATDTTAFERNSLQHRIPLKAFIIPSVLIGGGVALLDSRTREPFQTMNVVTHLDDYLVVSPYALRVGLQVAGVKPNIKLGDEIAVTIVANVLAGGVTEGLKRTVGSLRPNGEDRKSFPSGHAAISFTGAELLHQAYRHKSPWISVAGYTLATATSVLRVANLHHHWGDVLAGAGIGIASVKLTYLAYPLVKKQFSRHRKQRVKD